MNHRQSLRAFAILLIAAAFADTRPVAAQSSLTGFASARSVAERDLERRLQAIPNAVSAQRNARILSAKPHIAGTPEQIVTASHVLQVMAAYGLDTMRVAFKVYLPYHDSTIVERASPSRKRLDLNEPAIESDPSTQLIRWPAMNGTSGRGDATGPVVYVNYGLEADYKVLDSLGISVKGKIALARYGRSFRGIKEREAEVRGAKGLLLYSDPKDDGFVRGAVYPEGPWRNANGVQRGSVFNGTGDPTTPGWPSLPSARRLPEDSIGIAKIPVVPISYGNASLFLKEMSGPVVSDAWQGGLAFPYHYGDTRVRARVAVWAQRGEKAYKTIVNTFGILRGTDFPDEQIIVGGHRDAWGPGAADNVSGIVSILEAARAWGTVAKSGTRPKRTLIFATWDAEEWGLVGSTEWVELMSDSLRLNAVAYINQDTPASGRQFGASGTASLQELLRDVTRTVSQPGDTTGANVYDVWLRRSSVDPSPTATPPIGDLGGGSDFAGFYNHLGIPSIEFAFGGVGGTYHSAYDTWTFMEKFGDLGYLSHVAAAKLTAVLMARLAQADVMPFNYAALGTQLEQLVIRTLPDSSIAETRDLLAATRALTAKGSQLNSTRTSRLENGTTGDFRLTNARLREVERTLTRESGLRGRPFMRNLMFAADRDNGYANVALPGIAEALRDKDQARARGETTELTAMIRKAIAVIDEAMAGLGRK